MKKILFSALGLTGLLGLASCAQEDVQAPTGDGINITVRLPHSLASRATTYGDGTDAGDNVTLNNLAWTVYEVSNGTNVKVFTSNKAAFTASQTEETVSLPLAKGKTYQIAFYADDSANAFATFADGQISVDYTKGASNDVAEDVFCGKSTVFTVDGAYSETVTLTRPFAQLNWGTDDVDAPALAEIVKTLTGSVSVTSGLYTGFDVIAGDVVSGTEYTEAVNFPAVNFTALPEQKFPLEQQPNDYSLIAMNYLLTGNGVINCELSFNNGLNPVSVSAAPVQINHRTNIYGSLLTAPAEFNILINNNFDLPGNDLYQGPSVWDGETVTTPAVDDVSKTVTLAEASDLAGLAKMVNEGNFPTGYTVLIDKDMDMSGKPFTPVGNAYTRKSSGLTDDKGFTGVIDGQNHSISNVNIDGSSLPDNGIAAVFTTVSGENSAIKNINFENLTIDGGAAEQVGAIGLIVNGASVENVNILSGSIKAVEASGLVARMMRTGSIKNCNNAAEIVSQKGNAGGIVGAAYYNSLDGMMTIENCHNTGNVTSGNVSAGGIVGLSAANVTNCTNSGTITVANNSVGGIVGGIYSSGTISGCTNNGKIINNGSSIGAAGIVGWIRYQTVGDAYPRREIVTVENCVNNADIVGGSSAGGIVGTWYYAGNCLNNTNNAKTITTTSNGAFAGGIIGASQFIAGGDPFPTDNLVVTGNTSTTALDNITAQNKSAILYVNNSSRVTLSDNTPDQQ